MGERKWTREKRKKNPQVGYNWRRSNPDSTSFHQRIKIKKGERWLQMIVHMRRTNPRRKRKKKVNHEEIGA